MMKINAIFKQVWISIMLGVIIVPTIFFICLSINYGYPNIKFHYGTLKTKELDNNYMFRTDGLFEPFKNTITINVNKSKKDIVHNIYHEYGHYIYQHLDKKDKNVWKTTFCKRTEMIGYYKFQLCNEEFSDGFANYLMHKMDTIEEWNYFENITMRYLT